MHFGMNGTGQEATTCVVVSTRLALIFLHLPHCRIAGNGASEKNLKDGVCAQFEKNFAKAKWRV